MLRWSVAILYLFVAILWLFLRKSVIDAHELYDKLVSDHMHAMANAAFVGAAIAIGLALTAACRKLQHSRTLQVAIIIGVLAAAYVIVSLFLVETQGNLRLTA